MKDEIKECDNAIKECKADPLDIRFLQEKKERLGVRDCGEVRGKVKEKKKKKGGPPGGLRMKRRGTKGTGLSGLRGEEWNCRLSQLGE